MSKRTIKYNEMTEFEIDEISGVDRPAQPGARVTLMKRAPEEEINKRVIATSVDDEHQHTLMDVDNSGRTSFEDDHSHSWIRHSDGTIEILMADGHTHDAIVTKNTADDSTADGEPESQSNEGTTMTSKNDAATEQAVTKEQFEGLQAELQLAKAYGALTDAEKAHAAGIPEGDERNAFVSKSADERAAIVKAATADDPVVYKSLAGKEYRKSDSADLVEAIKAADDSTREVAKMQAERRQERLEKRAADEIPNLKGDVATKAAILGAIDGLPSDVAEKARETLKAANESCSASFETIGEAVNKGEAGDAERELEKLAQTEASENHEGNFEKGLQAVLATPRGRELYKQTR